MDIRDFLAQDVMFNQGLAMMSGENPTDAARRAMAAQTQASLMEEKQRKKSADEALGIALSEGGLTMDTVKDIAKFDPERALKLMQMLQEMNTPQLKHKFNPVTGEAVIIDERTGLPVGGGMGGATQSSDKFDANLSPAARQKGQEKRAIMQAEKAETLRSTASKMPELVETVNELSGLSDKATYTAGGQALDYVARQFGEATPGAVARTEYESKVNNQILPLLRDTFGAQFTEREGETLKRTLGDIDKTPQEKNAVLRSFINQKINDVRALGRELDVDTGFLDEMEKGISIQGESKPSMSEIEAELRRRGAL